MKRFIAIVLTLVIVFGTISAFASEVNVAVVDVLDPVNRVSIEQGQSAEITINIEVIGKQEGTATFKVYSDWTLSNGKFVGSNEVEFTVQPRAAQDSVTTFTTTGTVSVDSTQNTGAFTLRVGAFGITNSNNTGAKLAKGNESSYSVTVTEAPSAPADTTAPTLTYTLDPAEPNGLNDWYTTDVTVSFTAEDDEDGSGINIDTMPADYTLTYDGEYEAEEFNVEDNEGNIGRVTVPVIKIDKTAPTITGAVDKTPNDNGWYKEDVTVSFNANDNLSGIDTVTPNTTLDEGKNQSVTGIAFDKAGNSSTYTVSGINIDKTAPVITAAENQVFVLNSTATPNYSVEDELSGVDSSEISGFNTNTVGTRSYTITAVDKAGNSITVTRTYKVEYNFGGVLDPIGKNKAFKAGSTVPVKFQLTDANGNFVLDAVAKISYAKLSNDVYEDDVEAVSTSAATTGNFFRYDSKDNQYIFNLSTKGLSSGTYRITITLSDGTTQRVEIGLK